MGFFDSPEEKRAKCILAVLEKYDGKITNDHRIQTYMDVTQFLEFITSLYKAWLYSDLKKDCSKCKTSGKKESINLYNFTFNNNSLKDSTATILSIMDRAHRCRVEYMLDKSRIKEELQIEQNNINSSTYKPDPTYILRFWSKYTTYKSTVENVEKEVCKRVYFIF
jgi:hypothetical protein